MTDSLTDAVKGAAMGFVEDGNDGLAVDLSVEPARVVSIAMLTYVQGIDELTGKLAQFKIAVTADGTIRAVRPSFFVDEGDVT